MRTIDLGIVTARAVVYAAEYGLTFTCFRQTTDGAAILGEVAFRGATAEIVVGAKGQTSQSLSDEIRRAIRAQAVILRDPAVVRDAMLRRHREELMVLHVEFPALGDPQPRETL